MDAKEIIKEWLKTRGFEGLAGDGCGCSLDDLMPCDQFSIECAPAYRRKCDKENCDSDCDGPGDFCMKIKRPRGETMTNEAKPEKQDKQAAQKRAFFERAVLAIIPALVSRTTVDGDEQGLNDTVDRATRLTEKTFPTPVVPREETEAEKNDGVPF